MSMLLDRNDAEVRLVANGNLILLRRLLNSGFFRCHFSFCGVAETLPRLTAHDDNRSMYPNSYPSEAHDEDLVPVIGCCEYKTREITHDRHQRFL